MNFLIRLLIILFLAAPAFAGVHTAASCNQPDIDATISAVKADGQPLPIMVVPMGNCPTTVISAPKAIILQGAGKGLTTVATINIGNTGARATGFTVTNAAGGPESPLVLAEGQGWRFDHSQCVNVKGVGPQGANSSNCVFATGQVSGQHPTGLIDHVEAIDARFMIFGNGRNDWSEPSTVGVAGASGVVTIEDSSITSTLYGNCFDLMLTARITFRKNKTRGCWYEAHSKQVDSRNGRSWEIYDNIIELDPSLPGSWIAMFLRGGTGVVFNNTFVGQGSGAHLVGIDNGSFPITAYPMTDQIGRGRDLPDATQQLEPAYFWNNKRADGTAVNPVVLNGHDSLIQVNRDYFLSARPNYTPTPYPHPLQGGSIPIPPQPQPEPNQPPVLTFRAPSNLQVITVKNFKISVESTDDTGVTWQELSINGQVVKAAATATMTYSWNTAPYKGKGPVVIKAVARDADGSSSEQTRTVTVRK
jgi:hypothetical protein